MDAPFSINVSSVGFKTSTIEVNGSSIVNIVLEGNTALDEVVVSASRTPQRVFESPVTIERFDKNDIKKSASADF
jgi:iron complex outermembrane receptor protein